MESVYPKLTLCGSKNVCAKTDTVFFPISEVSEGTVSLCMLTSLRCEGFLICMQPARTAVVWSQGLQTA